MGWFLHILQGVPVWAAGVIPAAIGIAGLLDASERHARFVALVGLAAFYGLETLARRYAA